MTARGLRNNNPLNIRKGNEWQGEAKGFDPSFETFQTMAYGYRAAIKLLHTYYVRYGCNTIGKLITRWAPANENNTERYISTVCRRTNIPRGRKLSWTRDEVCAIVGAMSFVENGVPANMDDVKRGWELSKV